MADENKDHLLTESDKQLITDWLLKNSRGLGCQWCGTKEFTVGPSLASVPLLSTTNLIQFGKHYPCAVALCNTCGQAIFFAARRIEGLIPNTTPKDEEAQVGNA